MNVTKTPKYLFMWGFSDFELEPLKFLKKFLEPLKIENWSLQKLKNININS